MVYYEHDLLVSNLYCYLQGLDVLHHELQTLQTLVYQVSLPSLA